MLGDLGPELRLARSGLLGSLVEPHPRLAHLVGVRAHPL